MRKETLHSVEALRCRRKLDRDHSKGKGSANMPRKGPRVPSFTRKGWSTNNVIVRGAWAETLQGREKDCDVEQDRSMIEVKACASMNLARDRNLV